MSRRAEGYFETDEAAHYAADETAVGPLPPEQASARKRRNVVIALGLIGFVALVFVITLVRLQGHVVERSF